VNFTAKLSTGAATFYNNGIVLAVTFACVIYK